MARQSNTTTRGGAFDSFTIDAVWRKAQTIPGYDANVWRRDRCGAPIKRTDYGSIHSKYGWEIDHVMPVSRGGTDVLYNLQPLHWQNNRGKSDNYPSWDCTIRV